MDGFDALVLGILQGITEFLPISSSGHLIIGEYFLGLEVESLKSFDVAVHGGTLLAILFYFWKDVWEMIRACGKFVVGKLGWEDEYAKLIVFIIIGTIPAVILGLSAEDYLDSVFRDVRVVGMLMIFLAFVFILGEFVKKKSYERERGLSLGKAFVVGVAQAMALIPGISRSGSTIVAGLFMGINREQAARFSFLLGIPAMLGAVVLTAVSGDGGGSGVSLVNLSIGFFSAFVFGLISVSFLMKFLKKHSLIVFALYLILMGSSVFLLV